MINHSQLSGKLPKLALPCDHTNSAPPARTGPFRATGFTLIELLVVVGVLGLLLGLTLSAIKGARSKSRIAQCLNNLKQLNLAMHFYTDEARDRYPLAIWRPSPAGPVISYDDYLYPYLGLHLTDAERDADRIPAAKKTRLLQCPEDQIPAPGFAGTNSWRRTYSMSEAHMVGGGNPLQEIQKGGVGAHYSVAWGPFPPPLVGRGVPVAAVSTPSATLVLVERPNPMNLAGNDHWAVTRRTGEQTNGFPSSAAGRNFHNGRFNYVYADGRIELQPMQATWGRSGSPTSWAGAWTIQPSD